ncbi:MAG: caspase family protein [Elusimicrobiota bacterium]
MTQITRWFLLILAAAVFHGAPVFAASANQSQKDKDTALIRAALIGDAQVAQALITAGADVNAQDPVFGQTALMWAASSGNAAVVKALLAAGADAGAVNMDGKTAADLAWGGARRALTHAAAPQPAARLPLSASKESMAQELALLSRKIEDLEERKASAPSFHSDVDTPSYHLQEDENKFALIIGVGRYKSLPPALFADRDAQAMRRFVLALGYPKRHVISLENSNATGADISAYLESWLPQNIGGKSELLVYFAGHGSPNPENGESYLVPWDADPDFIQQTGYPLSRLYSRLAKLKARRIVVALDSCFSGAGGRSVLAPGTRPLITGIKDVLPGSAKILVLSAVSGDEIAGVDQRQGHGLFTYYFLKGLNKSKGLSTIKSLYDYLKPQVMEWARLDNRKQIPEILPPGEIKRAARFGL